MMRFFYLVCISGFFGAAVAWGGGGCDTGQVSIANGCAWAANGLVNVPGITNSSQSRSFTVSPDGQFMVFESFGHTGRNSLDTGSRTYFFFPVDRKPSLSEGLSGQAVVRTASEAAIVFDSNGAIREIAGAKFKESPVISGSNGGGVEITYYRGILLDTGWSRGEQSIQNRNRISTFKDPRGVRCEVRNSEIFTYRSKYDVHPAFRSTSALADFLRKKCPNLDLSSLSRSAPAGGRRAKDSGAGTVR